MQGSFWEGYSGYLETDGYQGYKQSSGIRRCSCWAHIVDTLLTPFPKGKQYDYSQPAVQGVQYCNRLFAIEDSINKKYPGDYEKRKQLRLEKEKTCSGGLLVVARSAEARPEYPDG